MTAAYATAAPPAGGADSTAVLLQALRERQIPPLPASTGQPLGVPPASTSGGPPQIDALGLLRIILTNPQLQQALRAGPAATGAAVPRQVELPVPAPTARRQVRSVSVPLGAVMNAIVALAGQSMTELNEYVTEEEPEVPDYLVDDDGGFVVDPASADDRAALVAHLFRLSEEAQRSGWIPHAEAAFDGGDELDECDEWARAAGFL